MYKVSIGLPVYNGEEYVKETVDSILNQTFKDFELIISDNASSDRTEEICRKYEAKDRRIRYHRNKKNMGAAYNFNLVFELSKGQYFKWAAVDDLCVHNFLAKCVDILDKKSEVVLCYPKAVIIDKSGENLEKSDLNYNLDSADIFTRFTEAMSPLKFNHNPVYGLIRRNILSKTRLIGNYLASDRCLVAEISLYGPFYIIHEHLFLRRKHEKNIGNKAKDLEFYDPRIKKWFVFPEFRVLKEHIYSVKRLSVDLHLKFRLLTAILNWAIKRYHIFYRQFKEIIRALI